LLCFQDIYSIIRLFLERTALNEVYLGEVTELLPLFG
jgi:hypothetical protein